MTTLAVNQNDAIVRAIDVRAPVGYPDAYPWIECSNVTLNLDSGKPQLHGNNSTSMATYYHGSAINWPGYANGADLRVGSKDHTYTIALKPRSSISDGEPIADTYNESPIFARIGTNWGLFNVSNQPSNTALTVGTGTVCSVAIKSDHSVNFFTNGVADGTASGPNPGTTAMSLWVFIRSSSHLNGDVTGIIIAPRQNGSTQSAADNTLLQATF
jgi:hypothetical protein